MIGEALRLHVTSPAFRRRTLLAALLFMESSVLAAFFVPVTAAHAHHRALPALAGIAGLVGLAHLATQALPRTDLTLGRQRVLMAGLILLTTLGVIRFHVFGEYGLGDLAWARAFARDWAELLGRLSAAPLALAVVWICWWRGIHLAYRELSLQSVSFSFRLDMLWMVVAGIFWGPERAAGIALLVYLYFFFAIVAMALARVDEIAGEGDGDDQPFGVGWLSIMLGSGLLVVGLGWILARFYSPAGFARLGEWLRPVKDFVGPLAYAGLLLLGRLLGPILEFLLMVLQRLMLGLFARLEEFAGAEFLRFEPPAVEQAAPAEGGFPWVEVITWSVIGVLILLALIGLALSLRKMRQRQAALRPGEQHRLLGGREWREDLLDGLRAGAGRITEALGRLAGRSLGMELYAALSIRAIYANMSRLARRRGYPRHRAHTPYEYLPALRLAFAGAADEDLVRITEAYVGVHYGEFPSTLQELRDIRACWERVRGSQAPGESAGALPAVE